MRDEFRIAGFVSEALAETFPELDQTTTPDQALFHGGVTNQHSLDHEAQVRRWFPLV